jgi:hypothetical protein
MIEAAAGTIRESRKEALAQLAVPQSRVLWRCRRSVFVLHERRHCGGRASDRTSSASSATPLRAPGQHRTDVHADHLDLDARGLHVGEGLLVHQPDILKRAAALRGRRR